jgi:RNA polymerase sigma factor (sigma-70 family)
MEFRTIYEQYSRMVFNLALQYVQNREDAEEITQDTFVTIHHSMHKFEGKSQLSTWIYRITINKSLDFIKTKKRKKRFGILTSLFYEDTGDERNDIFTFDHPGVILEQREAVMNLFVHINSLPENQKTALILSKLEQKSQKEIAEIMQISPKAVESLVQRAKSNLAKKIGLSEG